MNGPVRTADRQLLLVPMEREHAEQICRWRYEPLYDFYRWPAWERMEREGIEFGDPALREAQYRSVLDGRGELIGFAQLFPMAGVTRLGMGLRPDRCGQGKGPLLAALLAEEALRRHPEHEIDLEVLAWNTRAIRAYEKAGFAVTDTYVRRAPQGEAEFHCMVYHPPLRR
ncbi:GNAT family N-acetyltransferase [Paenibacillus thailandensis]|uniref:GNAT family N-acetyltransferase n=1 Tax=Paenibacillus thailandensis TaxID=393250 RepID=A0ABW5R2K6_9BACL